MPQESRRSIGYRPFITCDDPRGVVECGTIRKQKNIPTQKGEHEKKVESHRSKQKNLNVVGGEDLSSKEMAIGGGEKAQSPTSLHLLEVSRGAQKLNRVISSWSNGQSKNNNRDIAKDLLKGALDLGESLAMLSRLQHSSSYTSASTKKQQKQKTERGGFDDDLETEEKDSVGLRDESRSGSSRDNFEEIKRVICDGFDRKDVFSDPSSEDACDDRRLDTSDVPSTSSSQSSIVHSSNFESPDSFLSSKASQKKNKKAKGSNLIAKLMGLEDASLRLLRYNRRKHLVEGEKIVNQKKPAFDLDSSRARKHEHDPQKSGWKRRTLDQMIEAVNFKGHGIKSSSNSHHSEFSHSKQRWEGVDSDDRPPIVIMRPLRFSCRNLERPIIPKTRAELDEEMLLKMRIRTNPLAQTDQCETPNFNRNFRKAMVDGAPNKNSSQGEVFVEGAIVREKSRVKEGKGKEKASSGKSRPHKKQLVEKNAEEAQRVASSRRKGEMKRRTKSESDLQFQDGDKLTSLKLKSSRGTNSTMIDMLQSATEKHGKQGIKSSSNSRKKWPESFKKVIKGAVQINGSQRYRDENREVDSIYKKESLLPLADSTRLAEDASQIEITDYVDDDHSSPSETPLLSSNRRSTQMITNGHGTTDLDRESQCSASANIPVEEGNVCSADEKQLYSVCDTKLRKAHEVEIVDLDHHAIHIQRPSTTSIHIEENGCVISTPSIAHDGPRKGSTGENKLKSLFLSSPPFINRVEELFNLKANPDTDFLQQTDDDIDHNDLSARMLLDCANELMELNSSQCSTARLQFPLINQISSISYYYTSFDHLLDAICDGIEALGCCYRQGDGDHDSTDRLLLLVKGDLRSRGMVSGVWDIGWVSAGSADEIEEITRGVDELVLDGLMEEILVDLTL